MQEPLLVAKSPGRIDVIRLRGGLLHPRWPMLSGLLAVFLGCVGYVFWYFVPCPSGALSVLRFFCESYTLPFLVPIVLIEVLFLLNWVAIFVLGYVAIEAPRRPSGYFKRFLRLISDVELVRWPISIYGVFILAGIIASIVLWLLNRVRIQPIPLALAIPVLLIAIWTQIYQVLQQRQLIKEKEAEGEDPLAPIINAIVSPSYLFSCLPIIRRFYYRIDQIHPRTIVVDMQTSNQTSNNEVKQ